MINTLLHAMSTRGLKNESDNAESNDTEHEDSETGRESTVSGRVRAMTEATLGVQDADDDSAEFLKFIALTIKNICTVASDARITVQGIIGAQPRAIASWVDIMDHNMRHLPFIVESIGVLTLMAIDDDLSYDVAGTWRRWIRHAWAVESAKQSLASGGARDEAWALSFHVACKLLKFYFT